MRLGLVGLLLYGCASQPPSQTLRSYAQALEEGDADRAWALLSEDYRRGLSREGFARALREDREEVRRIALDLRAAAERVHLHARVRYGEGEAIELVFEDGRWKLRRDPLDFYGQATPREALRSFLRAIERRRWDKVLRFVPQRWQGGMTVESLRRDWEGPRKDEIASLVRTLRAHLLDPIDEQGDQARMPYGPSAAVEFIREGGAWKIADPD